MSMWSALNITPTLMHFLTLFTTTQCAEIHALTRRDVRCVVLILNRSVSLVSHRSSKEAGGFSHVEPSWQEETREEVHGGPQCHRRRLTCTGQEGHRHDTAWAKVRMEVKWKTTTKSIKFSNEQIEIDIAQCVRLSMCGGSRSPVVFQQVLTASLALVSAG